MAASAAVGPSIRENMRSSFREIQRDSILLTLPILFAFALLLFGVGERMSRPMYGFLPGVLLLLVGMAVWVVRRFHYLASAWLLVLGCLATNLLLISWSNLYAGVYMLAWSVGLAALLIDLGAGALVAGGCTWLLLAGPAHLIPADATLCAVALVGVWSTFALMALTLRPLLSSLEWAWSSTQRSLALLDEARDRQFELKQALADLDEAHLQLKRLDRLTQALRQAAEDARAAKERFVANVSHELRTPLNMVVGFADMILQMPQSYGKLSPALLADLEVIRRNSQHLSSLIDDVLDLSQIETNQVALTKERLALKEIIEGTVVAVCPLFSSKKLDLKVDVEPDLPLLFADRTRIREILLNLLSNAGRFTESGGVCLCARRDGEEILISVADTGPGIPAEAKGRLFQPFQQVDTSLRRRYGGSGLGLAISKSFVELHGGKMWLESEVGQGTTFFVRLPIDPPPPPRETAWRWLDAGWEYRERGQRPLLPTTPVRPRLVILETGRSLQRLLERYLEGPEVVATDNLADALAELSRTPSQALLVNQPSVSAALQQLLDSTGLPFGASALVCSMPDGQERASALGAQGYLLKPISRDALVEALDRLKLAGRTVLIVDDEPEAVRLFWRMLTSTGHRYRVLTATNGQQALGILQEQRADVILLDLVMPGMDGFEFLVAKARDQRLRDIPVILMSARDPAGHPITTNAVAITKGGGLSIPQLLACIELVSGCLPAVAQPALPEPIAVPSD